MKFSNRKSNRLNVDVFLKHRVMHTLQRFSSLYFFFFQSDFDHVDNVFSFKWIFYFAVLICQFFITWKSHYVVDFMKKLIFRFFRNSFDRSDNKFFLLKRFVEKKSLENVFIMQNNCYGPSAVWITVASEAY